MGGQMSCIRGNKDGDENTNREPRPNQYEEINDDFVILANTNSQNSSNDDVSKKNVSMRYENVTIENSHQASSPTKSTIEIQKPESEARGGSRSSATTSNPKLKIAASTNHQNDNQAYQNVILSNTANEIQDTANKTHHDANGQTSRHCQQQQLTSDQSKSSALKTTPNKKAPVIVPLVKGKKKEKNERQVENPDTLYAQVVKTSNKDGGKAIQIKDPQASPSKGQQLNYIEVEFTSPPSAKKSDLDNDKNSNPATNYTDVIHEGGRLLLIQ